MSAGHADLHDELRTVARSLLADTKPTDADGAPVGPDWSQLADAGWLGLEVPEDADGAGVTFAETAVVVEELGRAASAGPYLGTVVLGVDALRRADAGPEGTDLLRAIAGGSARVAVVVPTGDVAIPAAPIALAVRDVDGTTLLAGRASFVPDLPEADHVLVVALDAADRPVLVHLTAGQAVVAPQPVVDATRSFGTFVADDVVLDPGSVWPLVGDPAAAVAGLLDRGALAVALDSLGIAEAMLAATVAYARERHQFGRPIGSFQAVKHACADMLVQTTLGRELVERAVTAVVAGDPGAADAVAMAKAMMGAVAVDVAGSAMQLHGGIGYTWESGIHTYLKRATLNRSLFGSPTAHRRRLARRYVVEGDA